MRRFRADPVPEDVLTELLELASLAPSVGNSQPWRWVRVDDPARRAAVRDSFAQANQVAADGYEGEVRAHYLSLKLEGLRIAPLQLAVFCDEATAAGRRLGQRTMPETLRYSTVTSVHTFWLAARARGLGVGWVSILDPQKVTEILEVAPAWRLVAYLCVGWPEEEHDDPELVRAGWQARTPAEILQR